MIRPSLFIATCFCSLASLANASDLNSLLTNSPFAPVGPGAAAGGDKAVEFRGSYRDPEKDATFFSIYDTATQRASWVGLNESGHPFVVRGYNAANDTLTLELNGHNINLALKHAQVQLAAAPKPVAPTGGPQLQPNDMSPRDRRFAAMATGPEGRPDPKRMEAFIEEMRRRRAARAQGASGENAGQPTGMPMPIPMPGAGPGPMPMQPQADPNAQPQR